MGLFNSKKQKFLSKLTISQRDEILITLILLEKMIKADGVEKLEEKEYLKHYLINCGITSQQELESILDRASSITEDEYDRIVEQFDQYQKLTILHELIGVICSDSEIDETELGLLFQISRDMNIEDDVIMDMLGPKKHLLAKSFQKDDESEEAPTKLDSVSNIQKTEKFCPKCGEHFNEDDRFWYFW